ncbi:hypothetical protein [Planomicrobium okeanokoites]|uniref:hypothetical protein n=1 Tax=Planomicrobium okeanokoites TaxID=244 RepID=UPI0030FD1D9A
MLKISEKKKMIIVLFMAIGAAIFFGIQAFGVIDGWGLPFISTFLFFVYALCIAGILLISIFKEE